MLHITRRKHASHTWRAILAGREVPEKGLIKRAGDGGQTSIWDDRWIPAHFDARPVTPRDGQAVTLVADLLNWNEELIRGIFFPIDADAILKIPVNKACEDWWAWEPEKHGHYSVKTAYRTLYAMSGRGDGNSPSSSGDESWKKVWKLSVPPKVQHFWCRVLHEFLQAKEILHRRHVEPTLFCELCGADR
jgi:hypothetical protein